MNENCLREVFDHLAPCETETNNVRICVVDEPGAGGASHIYDLLFVNDGSAANCCQRIKFQEGPVKESGLNGVSQEALLAIVLDRLRSFQQGQYPCRENAIAITKIEEALMWLHKRTIDRCRRGVEGTSR